MHLVSLSFVGGITRLEVHYYSSARKPRQHDQIPCKTLASMRIRQRLWRHEERVSSVCRWTGNPHIAAVLELLQRVLKIWVCMMNGSTRSILDMTKNPLSVVICHLPCSRFYRCPTIGTKRMRIYQSLSSRESTFFVPERISSPTKSVGISICGAAFSHGRGACKLFSISQLGSRPIIHTICTQQTRSVRTEQCQTFTALLHENNLQGLIPERGGRN